MENRYVKRIRDSGIGIYKVINPTDKYFWIPTKELMEILNTGLRGLKLRNLPLRTRSKVVKSKICSILGYPIPSSFKKVRPRFTGQNLDIYIQKANNLQIWNDEIDKERRYAILKVSSSDIIETVKIVIGAELASLDTTGTLTQKYQARLTPGSVKAELISLYDTKPILTSLCLSSLPKEMATSPIAPPTPNSLLPIAIVYKQLKRLVGLSFPDSGFDQERKRGTELHKIVCKSLGYKEYKETGQFLDIINQLLEVKLQMSPTIDLGLICPNSKEPLSLIISDNKVRHCDVRYALFYGKTKGGKVTLTNVYLTTGKDFFSRFPQFQGKVINKKIQMPLPTNFFRT